MHQRNASLFRITPVACDRFLGARAAPVTDVFSRCFRIVRMIVRFRAS